MPESITTVLSLANLPIISDCLFEAPFSEAPFSPLFGHQDFPETIADAAYDGTEEEFGIVEPADGTEQPPVAFRCHERSCSAEFASLASLKIHLKGRHGKGGKKEVHRICSICGLVLSQAENLGQHLERHLRTKSVSCKCNTCGHTFSSKGNLKAHEKTHIALRPLLCEICGRKFKHKSTVERHLAKHTSPRPPHNRFLCSVCNQSFSSRTTRDIHISIHGDPPLACPKCPARFWAKPALTTHDHQCHRPENRHSCDECARHFPSASLLARHRLIHGPPTFECPEPECRRRFKQRGNLARHINSCHTRAKSFPCDFCDAEFYNSDHLRVHRRLHTKEKKYCCEKCGWRCSDPSYMAQHLKKHQK